MPIPLLSLTASILINSPAISFHEILGLPVAERTIRSLFQAGVPVIHLIGDSDEIVRYLNPALCSDPRVQIHASPSESDLTLSGSIHYDPEYIKTLVAKKDQSSFDAPDYWQQTLSGSPEDYQQAEQKLFKAIRSKTEGWVAPHLNKPVSFCLTRHLLKTQITPNQITVANVFLALLAAVLVALPSYAAAACAGILMQLSSIIDGCDGEVAKLKFQFSRYGGWMDTIADDIANNALFAGLFVGLYRLTGDGLYWTGGWIFLILSLGVTGIIYHQLITTARSPNAKDFQPAWQATRKGAGKTWFDWIRPAGKRDFFIFMVMVLLLMNQRTLIFWVMAAGITGTFVAYFISFLQLLQKKS